MILNFGSLNIDHVYQVTHFVRPGETMSSQSYAVFAGGKGANQSIALARAGAAVVHAGKLGRDGAWLKDKLAEAGVDTRAVALVDTASGHAMIQVNAEGENCIILHGGANQLIDDAHIETSFQDLGEGDTLLLQNEINYDAVPKLCRKAHDFGMRVALNPAPMNDAVFDFPLNLITTFVVNEIEGAEMVGAQEPDAILDAFVKRWPNAEVVLTLGSQGVMYAHGETRLSVPAEKVKAIDTTAAGDTFIGYFMACREDGASVEESLRTACKASAICVARAGAADSIPWRKELSD